MPSNRWPFSLLSGLKTLVKAARRQVPPRKTLRPLSLEPLEDRCLLSATLLRDLHPDSPDAFGQFFSGRQPNIDVSGTLFSLADDGIHGYELWKSDGTAEGTVLVKDINPGPATAFSFLSDLANVNGTLFFVANDGVRGPQLWKSDGTEEGTVLVRVINPPTSGYPSGLTNLNGTLFFAGTTNPTGSELWKSDGTEEGTVLVKDIIPGSASGNPS